MYELKSESEYNTLIHAVRKEYADAVKNSDSVDAVATDIAHALLPSVEMLSDNDGAVLFTSAGVWGGRVDATNGKTINPYDVIHYSNQSCPSKLDASHIDIAITLLKKDLLRELRIVDSRDS